MTEAEKKDKILALLNIEENRKEWFYPRELNETIFKENPLNDAELSYLLESLREASYLNVTGTDEGMVFQYVSSITSFLNSGGFTGQEAERKAESEYQAEVKANTRQASKLVNWQIKAFWFTLGMAAIGAIVGVIALFKK